MPIVTRHSLITVAVLAFASLSIVGIFVWSGIYNIGADDTHTKPVYSMLQLMRERSIAARAKKLHPPPNLNDQALIVKGAGNYNAMCMSCHLAPGMADTELSKGLYPAPPNLTRETVDAASAFWVIKHGIKASGMPAWGKSMQDEYIWGMVAFLQVLPKLSAEQYKAMVDSSGGHAHGGGETTPHGHAEGTPANHHEGAGDHGDMAGMAMKEGEGHADDHTGAGEAVMHTHADGTRETHPVPKSPAKPAAAKPATTKPAVTTPDAKLPATPPATNKHAGMAMPETPSAESAEDATPH